MTAPLLLAADTMRAEGDMPLEPGSLGESIAVLSSTWAGRPWAARRMQLSLPDQEPIQLSLDALLDAAPAALEPEADDHIVIAGVTWHVPIPWEGGKVMMRLPEALLLLRAQPDMRRDLAGWFLAEPRQLRGLDDGRMAAPLAILVKQPDDEAAQREYARLFVTAPWRHFRIAPRSMSYWGRVHDSSMPDSLDVLRAMLSEPGPLPAETTIYDLLFERAESGAWRDRPDVRELLLMSSGLFGEPAMTAGFLLALRQADELPGEVDAALERLQSPSNQSVMRVVTDFQLACYFGMALDQPQAREQAAHALVRGLRDAMEPAAGSLAALEPELVKIAAFTMWRLGGNRALPRDHLWLTWRLYQWMIRQLDSLAPEQQKSAMEELIAAHPHMELPVLPDMLDPSHFGHGRLEHRLIAILQSLLLFRPRALQLLWTEELELVLGELSSRELTAEECKTQAISPPYSSLSWDPEIPRTVPELAARVRDALNSELQKDDANDT